VTRNAKQCRHGLVRRLHDPISLLALRLGGRLLKTVGLVANRALTRD
jgi:hypothetical protein